MSECNGICLFPSDLGLPEFDRGEPAYPHPDCPEHGEPFCDDMSPEEEEAAPPDPVADWPVTVIEGT